MSRIQVVGIGPGADDYITIDAQKAIARSDFVFAAKRHAHLIPESKQAMPLEPLHQALERIANALNENKHVSVLLSGDTGVFSMLPMLATRFGADRLSVHPGVSALQVMCAQIKETWQDAKIVSGHGRPISVSMLGHMVRTHSKVILFCDAEHDAKWAASALDAEGFACLEMIVGERLSYPDQQITHGIARDFLHSACDPLCLVMVKNTAPEKRLPAWGVADNAFIRSKTPMTKKEIRIQVLSALCLPQNAVVWDVGAGTGSVSIECARQCPFGEVFAIERDAEAVRLIQSNARTFRANNLHVVEGIAPDCLSDLSDPTHVFIGGSGGHMDGIFNRIEQSKAQIRVVATAVTLEGEQDMIKRMAGYQDFELIQVAVSRMEKVGAYHMMKAQNPVRIASGTWEGIK